MEYRQLTLSDLALPEKEIYQAMGYRNHTPDEYVLQQVSEVMTSVKSLCIPRYMFQLVEAERVSNKDLKVKETTFSVGKIISSYLPGMTHVCMFVATAGKEYEAYLNHLKIEGDILKEFVADAIGSAIAEACVTKLQKELSYYNELNQSLSYSPGYCGWNIQEQKKLFSFFPEEPCGIRLSHSCLMAPVKSVSGMIGMGKILQPQPYRCEICSNKHCYKRKEEIND
ncbi:MAG: vitamin B12 dependent-methionine synthase activation domain-containing protein [Parabacteroides sp.]|nr:vitamin B12 dependent-methionine synthase activation domain-containing protein [Parabacteroides sp.]